MLFSDEVRPAYVPNELITTYRELVRLQTNLTDEATRYRNEIHALLVVLFPEFSQLFADPSRQTALALLKRYPSACAIAEAGVEQLRNFFQELAPHRYGQRFAQRLVELASNSVASGVANPVRARSLAILCNQLSHTQENLGQLEKEITALVANDKAMTGLNSVEEFGLKVVATIRAELGEVERFEHSDQVVAYVGLDLTVKQSGKWRGQLKISKQGSGLLRRILYMAALNCLRLKNSAFKDYYQAMVARGLKGRKALMAVMRKMLKIAFHLLKSGEEYDPRKVWAEPLSKLPKEQSPKKAELAAAGA